MIDLSAFQNLRLRGDFKIIRLELTDEPIADAIGREAVARTRIVGLGFDLLIRAGLSQRELSVTLYHEILEAATVAVENPPAAVRELNEGDFDRAAYQAHEQFGKSLRKISTGCCNFTGSDETSCVANGNMIQIELIKLATGARLLRLTESTSGLALERTLDPKVPVSAQKEALAKVFQAALDQAQLAFP